MDEVIFLGALLVLVVVGLLLARTFFRKQTGRQRHHPVYHHSSGRNRSHRPASHSLVHDHSTTRMHAADDVWRSARLKSAETRWESGVVVANKILTDSELALEDREPEEGHGMPSIDYKPVGTSRSPARKSASRGRGRR